MDSDCKSTVVQQCFNSCIGADARQDQQPTVTTVSAEEGLGVDEEIVIWYMAGYVPFKLMKVYEMKSTQEDGNVLDCLSDMAISGPVDDFYAYTQERTRAVKRRGPAGLKLNMLSLLFSESLKFL